MYWLTYQNYGSNLLVFPIRSFKKVQSENRQLLTRFREMDFNKSRKIKFLIDLHFVGVGFLLVFYNPLLQVVFSK